KGLLIGSVGGGMRARPGVCSQFRASEVVIRGCCTFFHLSRLRERSTGRRPGGRGPFLGFSLSPTLSRKRASGRGGHLRSRSVGRFTSTRPPTTSATASPNAHEIGSPSTKWPEATPNNGVR